MWQWLFSNGATIIIGLLLALLITLIIIKLFKGKKSCDCGCSACPMSQNCEKRRK